MSLSKWKHVAAVGLLNILIAVPAASQITGTTSVGQPGVSKSVRDIMARAQGPPGVGIVTEAPIFRVPERANLPQNPAAQALPSWPPPGRPAQAEPLPPVGEGLPAPLAPQTLGTSFTGASLSVDSLPHVPPDTMGAIGPTQYIVMINDKIRSFNKTTGVTDGVLNVSPDTFFGQSTSDPRIRYDRLTARWIMVIISVASTPNSILIAISDAASAGTITGSTVFTFFSIAVTATGNFGGNPPHRSCFADYPTLGVDANALYIGTNDFCPTFYDSSDGYVVRKSSILGGGPIIFTFFRGLVPSASSDGPFTPQGVDNYDPASTEGYFIGASNAFFGELVLRRVSTPGGTPTISADITIAVNTTTSPITVPASGSTNNLDALDDRLFAAHIRNGRLWTAHNIQVNSSGVASSTGGSDGSRWYELQGIISPGTPSVFQSGTVFDSAASDPLFFWIPSILPSGQGHAAIGFSTAGAAAAANAGTAGRLAGDTAGTMQTFVNYTASTTAYNVGPGNPQRWGDFSYTSLDPLDDMTMWTIQEFCDATNSYGVRVVKLIAPPPATPSSAVPAAVEPGNPSINITITGTSASGSGFYDPGVNLASPALEFKHISGSASGGVTVNSVTFVDPTHVTLNISTVGATAGTKNITITNPDGQSATGIGILTVGPTAARVLSFNASPDGGGSVLLQWRTGSEVQTLGFNVFREENDRLIQLNSSLIASSVFSSLPGSGTAVAGQSYNWLDAGAQNSYGVRYWLEEIDVSGQSLWHGPVSVVPVILPRTRR